VSKDPILSLALESVSVLRLREVLQLGWLLVERLVWVLGLESVSLKVLCEL
jgi:hypothetical protein